MARQRIDWNRLRQMMAAVGRRIAMLAVQGLRAAKREASKDKYRHYLSEAYSRMRQRYPAVEDTAKEALDAIAIRPRRNGGTKRSKSPAGAARKKTAARKKPAIRQAAASKNRTCSGKHAA